VTKRSCTKDFGTLPYNYFNDEFHQLLAYAIAARHQEALLRLFLDSKYNSLNIGTPLSIDLAGFAAGFSTLSMLQMIRKCCKLPISTDKKINRLLELGAKPTSPLLCSLRGYECTIPQKKKRCYADIVRSPWASTNILFMKLNTMLL